jgi:DNA repair protein RadC
MAMAAMPEPANGTDTRTAESVPVRNPEEIRYIQAFSRIIGVREEEAMEYAQKKGIRSLVENATQLLATPAQREKHQAFLDLYRLSSTIDNRNPIINSPLTAAAFFRSVMDRIHDQESFAVAYLNTRNRVIDHDVVSIGTINSSMVHPREVFRRAIINKANAVIFCHNHPTGDLTPSPDDYAVTRRLKETGDILGIVVHDHIIIHGVNRDDVYSFKQEGVMEAGAAYGTAGRSDLPASNTAGMAREASGTSRDGVREIVQKLEQGIRDFFDGEKYRTYLRTMTRFHRYSVNNTMLIAMQKPEATLVAGFNKWQEQFGRSVKKGEHGIRIIAPAPVKAMKSKERLDPVTGKSLRDAQGKPLTEEVEVKLPTYRVVSVFDVSQTEGKPLPQLASPLHGDVNRFESLLEALRRTSPVPIVMEKMQEGMDGYFNPQQNRIALREGMSQAQTVSAAVHEIAHALLHNREPSNPMMDNGTAIPVVAGSPDAGSVESAGKRDRKTEEVQAESVSYAVCTHYGIPTEENSFGYIAGWSSGRDIPELKASLEVITRTVSGLIEDVDRHLAAIQRVSEVERFFDRTFMERQEDGFALYQLKEWDQYRDYRFRPLQELQEDGLDVERQHYTMRYVGDIEKSTDTQERLDSLYQQFNVNLPSDFTGHSMSVGDVVVLKQDGVVSAHYVDSLGFAALPAFLPPVNALRGIEDVVEQNDNQFDGIINNLPPERLEKPVQAETISGTTQLEVRREEPQGDGGKPSLREQIRQLASRRQSAREALAREANEVERSLRAPYSNEARTAADRDGIRQVSDMNGLTGGRKKESHPER